MITFKNLRSEINEAFTPKEIKMAIGVASDPRYKGGNYSGAVKAIEKIKKGLANHPQVAAVLKRQNEAVKEDGHKGVKSAMNERTNMFTDNRTGFQIDRFSMGKGKGVGFQINYGKGLSGKYIQVPLNDMNLVIAQMTKAMRAHTEETQNESKFEPHMMYDPKTGKAYKANTMDDHLRMKELGYTHKKIDEAAKVVAKIWYGPNNKTKSKSFPDEGKALAWVKKMQDLEDVSDYSLR